MRFFNNLSNKTNKKFILTLIDAFYIKTQEK